MKIENAVTIKHSSLERRSSGGMRLRKRDVKAVIMVLYEKRTCSPERPRLCSRNAQELKLLEKPLGLWHLETWH